MRSVMSLAETKKKLVRFIVATQRWPVDDDFERAFCPKAGQPAHGFCGWCDEHDKPRLECQCLRYHGSAESPSYLIRAGY
jgi:hypothetical protein